MNVKLGITADQFAEKFFVPGGKTLRTNVHPIFLDVRSSDEFHKNHIFGAINIDLYSHSGGSISESDVVSVLERNEYDYIFSGMKYSQVVLYDMFSGGNHLVVDSTCNRSTLVTSEKYEFIKYKKDTARSHPLQSLLNVFLQSFIHGGTEFCLCFNVLEGGCMTLSTYHPEILSRGISEGNYINHPNIKDNTITATTTTTTTNVNDGTHNTPLITNSGKTILCTLRTAKAEIQASGAPVRVIVITTIPHRKLHELGMIGSDDQLVVRYSAPDGAESRMTVFGMYGVPETPEDLVAIYSSLGQKLSDFRKVFLCPYTVPDYSCAKSISFLSESSSIVSREDEHLIVSQSMEVFRKDSNLETPSYIEDFSLCLFYSLIVSLWPPVTNSQKCIRHALRSCDLGRIESLLPRDSTLWLLLLAHETRHASISGAEFASLSCSEVWNLCNSSESVADLLEHSHPLNARLLCQSPTDRVSWWEHIKRIFT